MFFKRNWGKFTQNRMWTILEWKKVEILSF